MQYIVRNFTISSFIIGLLSATAVGQSLPTITKLGFTTKLIQLNGPCDWPSWDPKTPPVNGKYDKPGSCGQTAAQANPNDSYIPTGVMGQGLGYSFEETDSGGKPTGKIIFLFGDSISFNPAVELNPNPANGEFDPNFHAKDTLAWSTSATEDGFTINYYALPLEGHPNSPLFITEPGKEYLLPQPSGLEPAYVSNDQNISMGPFDIPNSGISLNGQTYLIVNTGHQLTPSHSADYSVLVKFDGVSAFTTGRTVSESNYDYFVSCTGYIDGKPCPKPGNDPGHFVYDALTKITAPGPCVPILGVPGVCLEGPTEAVGIYGNGQSRTSSLYFSYVPLTSFETGTDSGGNPATMYFAGYAKDGVTPKWTNQESAAQPLFWDNPPTYAAPQPGESDPGRVGNASLFYDTNIQLWLMIYDRSKGGTSAAPTSAGIFFTYAAKPWGPWQKPQMIYNACQAHTDNGQGLGDILFYYVHDVQDASANDCPEALNGINSGTKDQSAWAGPAGPVIGASAPFGHEAFTTKGGAFAPEIIGRFSGSKDGRLRLLYTLSTWNPYAVVLMETDFTVVSSPPDSQQQ